MRHRSGGLDRRDAGGLKDAAGGGAAGSTSGAETGKRASRLAPSEIPGARTERPPCDPGCDGCAEAARAPSGVAATRVCPDGADSCPAGDERASLGSGRESTSSRRSGAEVSSLRLNCGPAIRGLSSRWNRRPTRNALYVRTMVDPWPPCEGRASPRRNSAVAPCEGRASPRRNSDTAPCEGRASPRRNSEIAPWGRIRGGTGRSSRAALRGRGSCSLRLRSRITVAWACPLRGSR